MTWAPLAIGAASAAIPVAVGEAMQPREDYTRHFACLERIEKLLEKLVENTSDKPVFHMLVLQSNRMIPLNSYGRAYTSLFVPSTGNLLVDVPGVGAITIEFQIGWNSLCLPQGTNIGVPNASPDIHALYRASNLPLGNTL